MHDSPTRRPTPRPPAAVPTRRRPAGWPHAAAALLAAGWCAGTPAPAQDEAASAASAPSAPAADAPAADAGEANPPGPALPPNFQPPPAKPESLFTATPLIDQAESATLKTQVNRQNIRNVLRAGPLNADTRKLLTTWADWRARNLTLAGVPDDPAQLRETAEDFLQEIRRAGGGAGNERNQRVFKAAVFDAVIEAVRPLLTNHLLVRVQAVYLLSELDLKVRRDQPQEGYGPAIAPLLEVVADGDMSEPVQGLKTFAVRTIDEILRTTGEVPGDLRLRTGEVLAAALRDHPEAAGWYQSRLAQALPRVGVRDTSPLTSALTAALTDESRPFEARAAAAAALTRIAGVAGPERDRLPAAIRGLAEEMAAAYNAKPTFELRWAFLPLYFSLHPQTPAERNGLPGSAVLKAASLPGDLASVEQFVTPIVEHVRGQDPRANAAGKFEPIPAGLLAPAGP